MPITEYGEILSGNLTESGEVACSLITETGAYVFGVAAIMKEVFDSLSLTENVLRHETLFIFDGVAAADVLLTAKGFVVLDLVEGVDNVFVAKEVFISDVIWALVGSKEVGFYFVCGDLVVDLKSGKVGFAF